MVTAIISLFNPKIEVVNNIMMISKQVDRVILADNSLKSNNNILVTSGQNIIYKHMGGNLGIPRAFNTILSDNSFFWSDDEFVIFFDQDSHIAKDQINLLKESYIFFSKKQKVGAIGAAYKNMDGKVELPHKKTKIGENVYIVQDLITSSMLTKYGLLKEIGFWNEDLFLDGADWDLSWRLRYAGYVCILKTDIPFVHEVGKGIKSAAIKMRDCHPIRNYYRTRDNLYLVKKIYTPIYLKARLLIDVFLVNVLRIIFLDQRIDRLKYIVRGMRDYNENISGEYVE